MGGCYGDGEELGVAFGLGGISCVAIGVERVTVSERARCAAVYEAQRRDMRQSGKV